MGRPLRYPGSVAYLPSRLARMHSYGGQDTAVVCDERPFTLNENLLSSLDTNWACCTLKEELQCMFYT